MTPYEKALKLLTPEVRTRLEKYGTRSTLALLEAFDYLGELVERDTKAEGERVPGYAADAASERTDITGEGVQV